MGYTLYDHFIQMNRINGNEALLSSLANIVPLNQIPESYKEIFETVLASHLNVDKKDIRITNYNEADNKYRYSIDFEMYTKSDWHQFYVEVPYPTKEMDFGDKMWIPEKSVEEIKDKVLSPFENNWYIAPEASITLEKPQKDIEEPTFDYEMD